MGKCSFKKIYSYQWQQWESAFDTRLTSLFTWCCVNLVPVCASKGECLHSPAPCLGLRHLAVCSRVPEVLLPSIPLCRSRHEQEDFLTHSATVCKVEALSPSQHQVYWGPACKPLHFTSISLKELKFHVEKEKPRKLEQPPLAPWPPVQWKHRFWKSRPRPQLWCIGPGAPPGA